MTQDEIRGLFAPAPGTVYLDAATYGLPPRPTVEAMRRALDGWQGGTARWIEDWDAHGEACRALFAALIGAAIAEIALIPNASVGIGLVAATLRAGDEVVVPADEFTSVLFPLLVAARERGVVVRQVPFDTLAVAIGARTRLVAFSLVQSQTGRTAQLAPICRAAQAHDAHIMVDATHAIPFVPVDGELAAIDYLVCAAYKHLLCPRGVGFLYVRRDCWDRLSPLYANWRAADEPYGRYYGGPLTLAPNAARFDLSLAWLPWVGARASLALLDVWRRGVAFGDVLALARRLADHLGLAAPRSSVVGVPVVDATTAATALHDAGVRASTRAGAVRLSPHVYNTPADVDRAAAVIAPLVDLHRRT